MTRSRIDVIADEYRRRNPGSGEHYRRASSVIPAGATRSLNTWWPHPVYAVSGRGARLRDVDGNEYVDFLNNYTALLFGHADDGIAGAVAAAARRGTAYSFATPFEAELAEVIARRVPSVDHVRFTASGSEAVMLGVRIARAVTGRTAIAKAEGGFHGTYDDVLVSVRPSPASCGPANRPVSICDSQGLPPSTPHDVVALPFNDVAATTEILAAMGERLAAVVLEPMLGVGGSIAAEPSYLRAVQAACARYGIVLIFDEVITLRLSEGGAQRLLGVTPDLTVMGKIIGGGLPIGAIAGSRDLMSVLEPRGGHDVYDARHGGPPIYQGGTFTGNPLSLAAGAEVLRRYDDAAARRLNGLGNDLRANVNEVFQRRGIVGIATGWGSLFHLHVGVPDVRRYRDTFGVSAEGQHALFLALLQRGVVIAPRGMGCLSTLMDGSHVDHFVGALEDALTDVARVLGTEEPTRAD